MYIVSGTPPYVRMSICTCARSRRIWSLLGAATIWSRRSMMAEVPRWFRNRFTNPSLSRTKSNICRTHKKWGKLHLKKLGQGFWWWIYRPQWHIHWNPSIKEPWKEDTSLKRTPFPSPSTSFGCISTPEMKTPHYNKDTFSAQAVSRLEGFHCTSIPCLYLIHCHTYTQERQLYSSYRCLVHVCLATWTHTECCMAH